MKIIFFKYPFRLVFCCSEQDLVGGKEMIYDESYLAQCSWINIEETVKVSMQSYLDDLDRELSEQPSFKKVSCSSCDKRKFTSTTD